MTVQRDPSLLVSIAFHRDYFIILIISVIGATVFLRLLHCQLKLPYTK